MNLILKSLKSKSSDASTTPSILRYIFNHTEEHLFSNLVVPLR